MQAGSELRLQDLQRDVLREQQRADAASSALTATEARLKQADVAGKPGASPILASGGPRHCFGGLPLETTRSSTDTQRPDSRAGREALDKAGADVSLHKARIEELEAELQQLRTSSRVITLDSGLAYADCGPRFREYHVEGSGCHG